MKEDVQKALDYNINWKMESYRKKHLSHPDAEALVITNIEKDANGWTYTWKIEVIVPWQKTLIHESSYQNVVDFVNNSFKHFKEELSKPKE